ncbi:MAG TPA: PAS domain-containing sensor histidine kinase [Abditibacteriaceae bacterium]|nr:PAS domain-containing sensor histidine kinase [Abditibacteriaceae bacterium]
MPEPSLCLSQQELAALLIENVEDYAIFGIDAVGCILTWNPGVERILGYTQDEFIGRPSAMIFTPEDQAAGAPEHEIETALGEGRANDERWHMRKDGTLFWANGVVIQLRDHENRTRGLAKIMRDLTAHHQDKAEAARARQDAEEANRAKDKFLSVISHEMRTPLTTAMGWLSLMHRDVLDAAQHEQGMTTIERNLRALSRLTDDLMDLERIRTNKLRIELQPVQLISSIAVAIETVQPDADAKSIALRTQIVVEDDVVMGDEARLQQILLNLLSNAIKFTPEGGHVVVGLENSDGHKKLTISDSGQGMDHDFLPLAFREFVQGNDEDNRLRGGLGLGLSIAQQLVECHGGTIRVNSDGAEKGTTFTILLPNQGHAESLL